MKIKVNPDEFIDVIMSLLLDKIVRPDEVLPDNEKFNDISNTMWLKGMKPYLFQYYLDMNAYDRINYKRIKKSFEKDSNENSFIEIVKDNKLNENLDISRDITNDIYFIKIIVKKVVKILKQRKWLKGKITTEEQLEKIIDKVIKQEKLK